MAALRLWWDTMRGIADDGAARAPRPAARRRPLRAAQPAAQSRLHHRRGARARRRHRRQRRRVHASSTACCCAALPYAHPGELVTIFEKVPGAPVDKFEFSAPDFEIMREAAAVVFGHVRLSQRELRAVGRPRSRSASIGARVSPELFGVLGVSPIVGRALTAGRRPPERQAWSSSAQPLWTRVFGRDPSIVGRTIALDRAAVHHRRRDGRPASSFRRAAPRATASRRRSTCRSRSRRSSAAHFGGMYSSTASSPG